MHDRLNFFVPWESLPPNHENQLTRALLVVLPSPVLIRVLIFAVVWLLAGGQPAVAAPLCSVSTLGLQVYTDAQYDSSGCVVAAPGSVSVFSSASSALANAYATAAYGVNSAFVAGNLTAAGGTTDANAWSIWTDTLTITGGIGTGLVTFGAHLTGNYTPFGGANYTLAVDQGRNGLFTGFSTLHSGVPGGSFGYDVSLPYTFTYNTAFTLTSWLDLGGHLSSLCCGFDPDAPPSFSSDFTVRLDTVVLPVDALLLSAGGATYSAVDVPEPATLWLLGAALAALPVRRRRRAVVRAVSGRGVIAQRQLT